VTYEELLRLARRMDGTTLETVTGKRFAVGVYMDCPFFTPEASGLGRSDGRKAAERFVERYNRTGSPPAGRLRRCDAKRVVFRRSAPARRLR